MTLRDRFIASLLARGYRETDKSAHYRVFIGPAWSPLLQNETNIRWLVGASGALRWTRGRLSASHDAGDRLKTRLLDETAKTTTADFDLMI